MELIWFIRELVKRWRVLILVPVIAVLSAYFLTLKLPKVYKTSAQLSAGIVDDTQISLEESKEMMSSYSVDTKFSNLIELIESKPVYNLVSYKLLLHDLTEKNPFRLTRKYNELPDEKQKSQMVKVLNRYLETGTAIISVKNGELLVRKWIKELNYTVEDVDKAIKVEREGASDFIKIEAEAESAELAAFLANTLCEQFLHIYVNLRRDKNRSVIDFFERLAREKKAELDAKVEELKKYKVENKIINLYEQTKSIVNQISNLEIIREEENSKIPSLSRAIEDIEKRFTSKEKGFLEAGLLPYNERITFLKDKVTELNLKIISSGYTDKEARDTLIKVKEELYNLVRKASDNLLLDPNVPKQELVLKKINYELDLAISKKAVESMDTELRRLKNIVEGFTPSEATISSFEREINVIAEAYLVILNKLTYSKFESANSGQNVQVTQYATPPDKAEPSKRLLLIIVAGASSFVLTIIIIILVLYLDMTIKTPKQFIQRSGLELIGTINKLSGDKLDLRTLFSGEAKNQDELIFQNLLRTFRQHFIEKAPGSGVVLFTGNHSREGKTTLMICIAYSLRFIGKKVILIDTNFKSSELTKIFNAKPSLESIISGEISLPEGISNTSLTNIDIIGCKGGNFSPAELRGVFTFQDIINQLKPSYDYILIEGPSLLRFSDSKELLQVADNSILIFQANTTIQEDDLNSFEYLKSYREKFLGALLNKVLPENLEGLYGEIEKKRSSLRRFVKNLVKRNFTRMTNGKMKVSAD